MGTDLEHGPGGEQAVELPQQDEGGGEDGHEGGQGLFVFVYVFVGQE